MNIRMLCVAVMLVVLSSPATGAPAMLRAQGGALSEGANGSGLRGGYSLGLAYDHPIASAWSAGVEIAWNHGDVGGGSHADISIGAARLGYAHPIQRATLTAAFGLGVYRFDVKPATPSVLDATTKLGLPLSASIEFPLQQAWSLGVQATHHFVIVDGPGLDVGGAAMSWLAWELVLGYRLGAK